VSTTARLCALSLVTAFLFLAKPVCAGDPASDSLVQEGVSLRRRGFDDEALELFERAYALEPAPRTLAQIGFAQQALGLWVEAEMSLREALGAQDDAWIIRNAILLRAALAVVEQHLGWLAVDTEPDNAAVSVNGRVVEIGVPVRLPAGATIIEARAVGHVATRVVVNVIAGEHVAVRVVVEPAPVSHSAEAPAVHSARTMPANGSLDSHGAFDALRLGLLVAGGASLSLGIGAQIVRETHVAAYNDDARCNYGGVPRSVRCTEGREAASAAAGWMTAGYGAAIVFAATFAVLTIMVRGEHPRKVACSPTSSPGGSCGFVF